MPKSKSMREVLANAAAELDLHVVSYCDELNTKKGSPRYFHANVRDPCESSVTLRLKVVNTNHPDTAGIRNCCRYGNHVHRALVGSEALRAVVDVPGYWAVPANLEENYSCSELIGGRAPADGDLPSVVDALLRLKLERAKIVEELARSEFLPRTALNYYRYEEYSRRLCFSLRGLLKQESISVGLAGNVVSAFSQFEDTWPDRKQLTLVHGDFSFGNLRLREGKLAIIDFEHSHIGLGEIDLAHLYVNLAAKQDAAPAERLLFLFQHRGEDRGVRFDREAFRAAVLERVTGKMNSMSDAEGETWERLRTILAAHTEGTG